MTRWWNSNLIKWQADPIVSWWMANWWNFHVDEVANCWNVQLGKKANCWNVKLTKWHVDEMANCKNSKLMKYQIDEILKLMKWDIIDMGNLTKWWFDEMAICQNDLAPFHPNLVSPFLQKVSKIRCRWFQDHRYKQSISFVQTSEELEKNLFNEEPWGQFHLEITQCNIM